MNTTPIALISQVECGIERYEAWRQVLISGKSQMAKTIAEMVMENQRRWGEYANANPATGVSDDYIWDLVHHYLTQRRFMRALKQRQQSEWQTVLDRLTMRINQRLHTHTDIPDEEIPTMVQDMAQHCAMVIWTRLDTFPFDCSFWAWVEVLIATEMRSVLRSADHRHNVNAYHLDEQLPYLPQSESPFHQVDDYLLLERLLPALSTDQRLAITLSLYGYNGEEIADLMGRTVSAVHNLKSRAYQVLRRAASQQGDRD